MIRDLIAVRAESLLGVLFVSFGPLFQIDAGVSGAWEIVLQGGALGVMFLVLVAIMFGFVRTRQELAAVNDRAIRAERLVDTLIPAVDKLTDAISSQSQILARVSTALDSVLQRH